MGNRRASLDRIDAEIIRLLQENPDMPQEDIANVLRLSQSSVGARIRRLRNDGVLIVQAGVNARRLGLSLAKVDCLCQNATQVIDLFRRCPCFLNAFVTSGRYNVSLWFAAEDAVTLTALVDHHLRNNPNVKEVEFGLVVSWTNGFVVRPGLAVERSQTTPCGADCNGCPHYGPDECPGCPATHSYTGNIWKLPRCRREIIVPTK
jgi:DNA-binding Lrp family transcriptional regulator